MDQQLNISFKHMVILALCISILSQIMALSTVYFTRRTMYCNDNDNDNNQPQEDTTTPTLRILRNDNHKI